ncbi:hypothetical protein CBS101457_003692 [Exobasidium rhododendri]|nr:hypothetical protein CBS101457_003692 [Exobasidium rhododendri]
MSSSSKDALAPSLRLVPGPSTSNCVSVNETSHPVHAGVHDTMRYGPRNLATEASSMSQQHPMQSRLEKWDETRDNLKLTMQRNMFGLGAPIRTLMERRVVEHNPHFPAFQASQSYMGGPNKGLSGLHLDILNGNDETLEPVDFLPTAIGEDTLDIHALMERKHNI